MTWLLKRQLKNLSERSSPDRRFVLRLERSLRAQTGHPVWWVQGWKYAVAASSIALVACSATGVYAYTSDDVLPDTPLYTVRQGIEQVEQVAAVTPEQKTAVQLKMLQRRFHEQEVIAAKHKTVPAAKAQPEDSNLESVVNLTTKLSTSTQETVDEKIVNLEEQHTDALLKESTQATTPEQKQQVEDLLSKQRSSLQKVINSFQAERRARFTKLLKDHLDRLHLQLNQLNRAQTEDEHQTADTN
jgi:hypothetical protein